MAKFKNLLNPAKYVDRQDDSLLGYYALCRGSYNTLINDNGNISSRGGQELVGQAGTLEQGVKSAYTWETSTNKSIVLRSIYDKLQVLYNDIWQNVGTGYKTLTSFDYVPWWDRTEIKDKLIMVNGTTLVYSWTGGYTELASWTSTTITKKFAKQSSPTNNFVFNATNKTLTQTDTDFITLGFEVGQTINIAGTTDNNGLFTIKAVTASVITVSDSDIFTNETVNTTNGVFGILGRETWAAERFAGTGTLTININGTVYTYNAGWNTPTLTLTADPSASCSVGLFVFQPVASTTPSGGDYVAGQKFDIIEAYLNNIFYGYTLGRTVLIASSSNFASFAYTSPVRRAGEGGTMYLDNNCVGIAASDTKVYITGGSSDVYTVVFEAFSDGTAAGELIRVKKLQTAYGDGGISNTCFVKISNGILYLKQQKAIDYIGNVENIIGTQAKPVSYDIKRLMDSLNITGSSGIYTKNYVYYLIPQENILLMYDTQRDMWQPPQYVSGSCLSYNPTNGKVFIHSSVTDETYELFTGLNDNGSPIEFSAVTNVFTGERSEQYVFDEIIIEALVNGGAENVYVTSKLGYNGATNISTFQFGWNMDSKFIEEVPTPSGFGTTPFGSTPLGSLFTDETIDPTIGNLRKIHCINSYSKIETFSWQLQFACGDIDSYFEIVSWGINASPAPANNLDLKI